MCVPYITHSEHIIFIVIIHALIIYLWDDKSPVSLILWGTLNYQVSGWSLCRFHKELTLQNTEKQVDQDPGDCISFWNEPQS